MKTKKTKIALFTAVIFSFFVLNIYSAQASFLSDANSFFNNILGKIQKISVDLSKIFANEDDVWTLCANEGEQCNFEGAREVRFGADGQFSSAIFTDGAECSSGIFGDPVPGVFKSCSY